jgi:uncharacterized protein (TIGR03437 family)
MAFEALLYFSVRQISWTAASFEPASLIADFTDFEPTKLDREWTCGQTAVPQPGIGEAVITSITGDPTGFGTLRTELIANSTGNASPRIAPGAVLRVYTEQLGPDAGITATFDDAGRLPPNLAGTEVLFNGVPAPVLYTSAFQVNVQAPYELEPGTTAVMQVRYNGVPSNRLPLEVVEAAPDLFRDVTTQVATALNADGSVHAANNPAAAGGIIVLYAVGGGRTVPSGTTGSPAPAPHAGLQQPVSVTVGGQEAEVLFAGLVPGFVDLVQINVRLPALAVSGSRRAFPVVLRIGAQTTRSQVLVWIDPASQ